MVPRTSGILNSARPSAFNLSVIPGTDSIKKRDISSKVNSPPYRNAKNFNVE